MKTKKRTVKKSPKRVKTTTVGELFGKMLQKAEWFDIWSDQKNMDLGGPYDLSDMVRFEEGDLHVYGIGSWSEDQKIKIKGDTAKIVEKKLNFRFYVKKPVMLT